MSHGGGNRDVEEVIVMFASSTIQISQCIQTYDYLWTRSWIYELDSSP